MCNVMQAQGRQGTGQRGLLCSQKVQDGQSQTGKFLLPCFSCLLPQDHTFSHVCPLQDTLKSFWYILLISQICGDYLLSKMDSQNAISFRNFASTMGDARLLAKVDAFIQDHLLEVSEQEDFLKLPRLKVGLCTRTLSIVAVISDFKSIEKNSVHSLPLHLKYPGLTALNCNR